MPKRTPSVRARSYNNALKDLKFYMEKGGEDAPFLYLEEQGCEVPLCDALVKLLCAVAGDNKQIPVQVSTKNQAAILVGSLVTVFNEIFNIDGPNTLILPNDESVSFWAKLIRECSSKYLSGDGLDDGNCKPILSENTHSEFSKSIFKFGGLAIWKKRTLSALAIKKVEDKYMLTRQHYFGFMLSSILLDTQPVSPDFLKKMKQMFIVYIGDNQELPEDVIVFNDDFFGTEDAACFNAALPREEISREDVGEDVEDEEDDTMASVAKARSSAARGRSPTGQKCGSEKSPSEGWEVVSVKENAGKTSANIRSPKNTENHRSPSKGQPLSSHEDETFHAGYVSGLDDAKMMHDAVMAEAKKKRNHEIIISCIVTVASLVCVVVSFDESPLDWRSIAVISFNLLIAMAIRFRFI
ncbi:hypothetical protein IV203_027040 [Nitzschia inconspicua]|uniref:Uncharacterized protein n=1 Tax=Nitzschia inconspicua TaxID=303405 RepID=A0A9K3LJR2_9STRA|nr:hypothetical protein IV203_027040 [Nitzschia inconspicua]